MPTRKVGASTTAGSISVVLIWAAEEFAGVTIPGDVGASIATLIMAVVAYWVSDRPRAH